jgi:uncharacterized protein HemX
MRKLTLASTMAALAMLWSAVSIGAQQFGTAQSQGDARTRRHRAQGQPGRCAERIQQQEQQTIPRKRSLRVLL